MTTPLLAFVITPHRHCVKQTHGGGFFGAAHCFPGCCTASLSDTSNSNTRLDTESVRQSVPSVAFSQGVVCVNLSLWYIRVLGRKTERKLGLTPEIDL